MAPAVLMPSRAVGIKTFVSCQRPARLAVVVPRASSGENPYHNRDHTRKGNPGGSKDAGITHKDKDEQYAYQQERLEWRRKNQGEGIADRDEPPHTNMAGDMSAERRGPHVEGSSGHGDTLKELIDNVTGKKHKEEKKKKTDK